MKTEHGIKNGCGCLATDRIMAEGRRVGYMYRKYPDNDKDSGWRFEAGDESAEYLQSAANMGVYSLETLTNRDPDIVPYLDACYGSAYIRKDGGVFERSNINMK